MNKLLKWFLAVAGIISGLFLLLALGIYFFVDINHYKKDLEQLVKAEIGHELNITGDLKLSIIKGVKFKAHDVSISSQQETIADIARVELGLKLSTLFTKQPVIDTLVLDVRELKVKRDKQGNYNFLPSHASKISESKISKDTSSELPVNDFSIEDIHINIEKLLVEDEAASLVLKIRQLEAVLSKLPIIEQQELVADDPRILTNYNYKGSLKVNLLDINPGTLKHYQLSDLSINFDDQLGQFTAQQLAFKLKQLPADKTRVKGQKGAPLVINVKGKMTAAIAYQVPEGTTEPQWEQPESIIITQLDLLIKDLSLNNQAGRFKTRDLNAELKNIPLYTAGQWVAADLLVEHISLETGELEFNAANNIRYLMRPSTIEADHLPVFKKGKLADFSSSRVLRDFAQQGAVKLNSKGIEYQQHTFTHINLQLLGKKGRIELLPFTLNFSGAPIKGKGTLDLTGKTPKWKFQVQGKQVNLEAVSNLFGMQQAGLSGRVDVDNNFSGRGLGSEFLLVDGEVNVSGNNIQISGVDMDAIIDKFSNSQSVGLMDVGAFALLGPAGMLLNKGNDYLELTSSVGAKGSSHISQLRTHLLIKNSIAQMEDVALATAKHRLAFKGEVDLVQRSFKDFQVATVDEKGCALYEESITGTFAAPRPQKVNLLVKGVVNPIASVLAKVTDPLIGRCQTPFYTGSVKSPY